MKKINKSSEVNHNNLYKDSIFKNNVGNVQPSQKIAHEFFNLDQTVEKTYKLSEILFLKIWS